MTSAFCLGLAGTTLFSRWADAFVLTWPACIYLAFRTVIGLTHPSTVNDAKLRCASRLAALAFVAFCFGYFKLCSAVGYAVAWSFLFGFLPAAQLAVWASRTGSRWTRIVVEILAFAVYFWLSGFYPSWRERIKEIP